MLYQLQLEDEPGTKFLDFVYVVCVKSESTTIGLLSKFTHNAVKPSVVS